MDWVKWIIPLIAVAVWILSNLANQQREARRVPRAPTLPPPRPRDPLDSTTAGPKSRPEDDDKYREEMDRQRKKKVTAEKPLPRPRPRRLETLPKSPPPPVVVPVLLPASPSRRPVKDQRKEPTTGLLLSIPPPLPVEFIGKVGEPAVPVKKPTPMAIKNMLELLKKPESLTTAFLLKEVLDLPVSKRARRRM